MASTLNSASLNISFQGNYSSSNALAVAQQPSLGHSESYTAGTGANQGNIIYFANRTLAATTETLDLSAGGAVTLVDVWGVNCAFSKVKFIAVYNTTTTTGKTLLLGGAATPFSAPFNGATTACVTVGAGGSWAVSAPTDGFTVDGTHKLLLVDAGANTVTYTLIIVGS